MSQPCNMTVSCHYALRACAHDCRYQGHHSLAGVSIRSGMFQQRRNDRGALTIGDAGGIHGHPWQCRWTPHFAAFWLRPPKRSRSLAGGVTFIWLGLPAGLVSGSVLAVATAALLGRPVRVPLGIARICYVIVGTLLGTVVTPETLRGVTTWPASIALLMVASLGMIAATMGYLRVVHRWDSLSALMGASPGSMAQVIALSSELGGDLRAVAIVQTVRVLLLVLGLPNGLALFGLVVPAVPVPRGPAGFSVLGEMILLLSVAATFALIFMRLRFPGGLLFGALTGSAILHGTGLVHA